MNEIDAGVDNELLEYIRGIKFRKKLMGISEEDLWSVVERLQNSYEAALRETEIRLETEYRYMLREMKRRVGTGIDNTANKEDRMMEFQDSNTSSLLAENEALKNQVTSLKSENIELKKKLVWALKQLRLNN